MKNLITFFFPWIHSVTGTIVYKNELTSNRSSQNCTANIVSKRRRKKLCHWYCSFFCHFHWCCSCSCPFFCLFLSSFYWVHDEICNKLRIIHILDFLLLLISCWIQMHFFCTMVIFRWFKQRWLSHMMSFRFHKMWTMGKKLWTMIK